MGEIYKLLTVVLLQSPYQSLRLCNSCIIKKNMLLRGHLIFPKITFANFKKVCQKNVEARLQRFKKK